MAGAEVGQIFRAWAASRSGATIKAATPSERADAGGSSYPETDEEVGAEGNKAKPDASVFAEVVTAAIPALPLLLPLWLIGILAERDVFAAILWQGDILALTLGLVPLLIPFLAFSALYLLLRRVRGLGWRRAWQASCCGLALLPLVPPTVGLAQAGIVAIGFLQVIRQGTGGSRAGRGWLMAFTFMAGLGLIAGGVWLGMRHWEPRSNARFQSDSNVGSVQRAILGRLYTGMPQELISVSGEPRRAYFVVHVDDNAMTAVSSYPSKAWTIQLDDIKKRTPCINREAAVQRSLIPKARNSFAVTCQGDSSEVFDPTAGYVKYVNTLVILTAFLAMLISVRSIWVQRS